MKRLHHDEMQGIGNRQVAMCAKKTGSWCMGCDASIISQGQKCPVCGNVQGKNGNKRKRKNIAG